jgi:hypothetical protein
MIPMASNTEVALFIFPPEIRYNFECVEVFGNQKKARICGPFFD